MKPIQLVVLGVALVAAIGLAMVARNMMSAPSDVPVVQAGEKVIIKKAPTVDVLVANESIPMGSSLKEDRLAWEEWPETSLREAFITRDEQPDALEKYAPMIAKSSFFEGEPVREAKLVQSDSGYLSAILPAGKRAVAMRIQADTSAGGFVLPNDHVDVVMSYKNPDEDNDAWLTETVLQNVRVLAIDQVIEEQDGEKSKVGSTATLELTAQQVEIITASQKIGGNKLTLALRSVEDSEIETSDAGAHLLSSGSRRKKGTVKIIRYGSSQEVRPRK